jgi:pyridoxal phosphate enzyme (YggS family)
VTIGENLAIVRERIEKACEASGRSISEVGVMAVTKTHPAETVRAAVAAGIRAIGENRVTEGGRKVRELGADFAEFHLIGPVHTREVRQAARDFRWIDSVDRTEIASELIRRNAANSLLVEVNTSGEPGKKGFPPDHDVLTEALGMMARSGLRVEGLMTVGPLSVSEMDSRRAFALLRELRDRLKAALGLPLDTLSMGMSDDYVHAVREGSTMVRLGRVLLGGRR